MKILRDIESPPGGWRVTVPQTDTTITSPFVKSLRYKVLAHMDANGIEEPEDFEEWFETAVCEESGHGEPFCGEPAPVLSAKQKLITPSKAKRFLRTMLELLKSRKLVSREEAQRRMDVCTGGDNPSKACPMVGDIGNCWNCYAVYKALRKLLKKSPVEIKDGKRFCLACGCHLSKVWIPNKTLDKAEKNDPPDYAARCWRRETSSSHSDPPE